VAITGIGIGLIARNYEEPFAAVWSALFVVAGLMVVISYVSLLLGRRAQPPPRPAREVMFEDEQARYFPRRANAGALAGNLWFALLGGWFLVMGVVGGIEENWLWPVLAAFPAAYLLGFVVFWAVGRFRVGGIWVTETRIIDEHLGLRRAIEFANVKSAYDVLGAVQVQPEDPSGISYTRLTPRLWCTRLVRGEMLIQANGIEGGPMGFAAELHERAVAAQHEPKRRRWGH
jgi:hypothetical protein